MVSNHNGRDVKPAVSPLLAQTRATFLARHERLQLARLEAPARRSYGVDAKDFRMTLFATDRHISSPFLDFNDLTSIFDHGVGVRLSWAA